MREKISERTVLYTMPGVDEVAVEREVTFAPALTMDVYRPTAARAAALPAVVIVAGYPDPGFEKRLGCRFKDMGSTVSWARLIAASGMMAIAYTNREPAADVRALLRFLRQTAGSWGIDEQRIGVWASSGNAAVALSLVMRESPEDLKCAALLYGCTLDVAEAAGMFGFANPGAGKTVDDLAPDVPLFIVRAGLDHTPGLNASLDRFVCEAVGRNLPITLVNQPSAPHAFDLFDDSAATREVIRQVLAFLRFQLSA